MASDYLKEAQAREALQAREADENNRAIATARRYGKNVTFIAHDGCEVTVTPGQRRSHSSRGGARMTPAQEIEARGAQIAIAIELSDFPPGVQVERPRLSQRSGLVLSVDRPFGREVMAAHTPGPWTIAPLESRKYYGTEVLGQNGKEVCRLWTRDTFEPSARQAEIYGPYPGDDDQYCDTHYEIETDYANASLIALAPELFEYVESSASAGCATAAALIAKLKTPLTEQ